MTKEMTTEEINEYIHHLPSQILFDLARNQSANYHWRKAAVEMLIDNNYPQAKNPELLSLVLDVQEGRKARAEVESVIETAIEAPVSRFDHDQVVEFHAPTVPATLPEHSGETLVVKPSVFQASFTTESQTQDEVIEN